MIIHLNTIYNLIQLYILLYCNKCDNRNVHYNTRKYIQLHFSPAYILLLPNNQVQKLLIKLAIHNVYKRKLNVFVRKSFIKSQFDSNYCHYRKDEPNKIMKYFVN